MALVNEDNKHKIDVTSRYKRAQVIESGLFNKNVAFNTTLYPHWIGDSDSFWYIRQSKFGQTYRLVDAKTGSNAAAFDHDALSKALADASGQDVSADNLCLVDIEFSQEHDQISFSCFGKRWIYKSNTTRCEEIAVYPQSWKVSPDGKNALFTRDYNLWIKNLASGEEKALSQDGKRFFVYASTPTVYGRQETITLEAIWSPDSKRVVTQLIDTRNVAVGAPLVQHVPTDGSLRPNIIGNPHAEHPEYLDEQRRVAFPGDEQIETYKFLAIEVESGKIQFADYRDSPVFFPPYAGYFTGRRGWWDNDNRHAYFIDQERGGKALRLIRFDSYTGDAHTLLEENSDSIVTLIPISHVHTLLMPLSKTNELIWFSERSGWAHFYLYDLSSGELKAPITQGKWMVRNILHFDAARRELFIQTAGRVSGRNPYYCDICRVNIDTGELTEILSSNHEYIVCDQRSRIALADQLAAGVAPSGNYVITTRSRVDEVPISMLLDREGRQLMELETADVSGLPEGCHWPEPLMLKSADDSKDIYGVVFRPSDFDPNKSYPVLDCTYGYASPVGAFTNNHTGNCYLSAWAYAELGFIAVIIINRGNEGLRDSVFNSYEDPVMPIDPAQLARHNKSDTVAGIKQLADRYSYMDISRVGVADFGTIPMALTGMLIHPEFYKVGVSNNPMADSRIFSCTGSDCRDKHRPQFEEFVENFCGKMLLIAGMLDDVIPVSMTFRIVEALQKSNKRFDMLLLPNLGHDGLTSYTTQRSWDYFVEHLQGIEPPHHFKLTFSLFNE